MFEESVRNSKKEELCRAEESIQQPAFGVKRMPLYSSITDDGFVFDETKAKIANRRRSCTNYYQQTPHASVARMFPPVRML
jgi:hypothetical protein